MWTQTTWDSKSWDEDEHKVYEIQIHMMKMKTSWDSNSKKNEYRDLDQLERRWTQRNSWDEDEHEENLKKKKSSRRLMMNP